MFLKQIPPCHDKPRFPFSQPRCVLVVGARWPTGLGTRLGSRLWSKPGFLLQVWVPGCARVSLHATSRRWRGGVGTGLFALCCSKCQCKLGKTCFLKKISTLNRKRNAPAVLEALQMFSGMAHNVYSERKAFSVESRYFPQ